VCLAELFWTAICVVGGHSWLEIPFRILPSVVLTLLLSLNAALVGSVAGAVVKDKVGLVQVLFFFSMPALLLSGGSWPLSSMPRLLQGLALLLPSTHIMTAYRRLALEGAGFIELLPALGSLAGLGLALLILLRWLLVRVERRV
jgi:ABC-2 type transport system permease protein